MLEHLKVLDLTDERGLLCGRLLRDLGADVVQVEPLGGCTARQAPPLTAQEPSRSLFWESFAAGKRGVRLDLDDEVGRETFRRLAEVADVVVTSYSRSWLLARGLDPESLRQRHPALVHVAITPFGWTGPKAEYADCDLVVWAAGGPLEPHRDGDRPPLRISVPQAFLHASADAAAGAMTAVQARSRSGKGQLVDVSAQAALGVATLARVLASVVGDERPEWHQQPAARSDQSGSGAATPNALKKWYCADGMVELHLSMGPAAGGFTNNLFRWLADEGAVQERIAAWDWREVPALMAADVITTADLEEARAAVRAFLLTRTKAEVVAAALERRLLCMAIYDMGDVLDSPHLAERGFWGEVLVGGRPLRIPGVFAQVTGAEGPRVRGRAPQLGEHTREVLREWLGEGIDERRRARQQPWPDRLGVSSVDAGALGGLKVLDLSWVVAGPLIGRALADFGADVVRVESSTRVETARLMQPFHDGVQDQEGSALFGNCNAGKRGVTLDLKSEEGRAVARDLVAWADVVIESFSPGQLDRWGLGYDQLSQHRPDLVMLSTSIAGQSGPWSRLAGYGNVGSSLSGFQNLVGWEDGLPLGPFGPYTDYVGPRIALTTLLAALDRRDRTGQGCYIDVAQVESGVLFLSPQVAHASWDGTVARRRGNADELLAPHAVFACAPEGGRERWAAVVARTDSEWRRVAEIIGRPDLAARPDLATAAGRRSAACEVEAAITAWTSQRTASEVETSFQSAGVPAHVAASSTDFVSDPQLRHRGHVVSLPSDRHGTTYVEGPRYLLSEHPGRPRRAAPSLGQDNEEVLRELLGYDDLRVAGLMTRGVMR